MEKNNYEGIGLRDMQAQAFKFQLVRGRGDFRKLFLHDIRGLLMIDSILKLNDITKLKV